MPVIQVKKVVAVCFLEAAKVTLEHLGAYRLDLSQRGERAAADLSRLYGEMRRLRDYLQRCASAFQDVSQLELSKDDATLLVACCRRAVEAIEAKVTEGAVTPDERVWLERKRKVLGDWAVELATKPLLEMQLPRVCMSTTEEMRSLTARLQAKVYGDVNERQKIVAPRTMASSSATGLKSFGDQLLAANPAPLDETPEESARRSPRQPLLDRSKVKEPRLRALVDMDQKALERALEVRDFRIATVLIGSIMESALLDHVLARRAEFGVTGTPDGWNLPDLLLRAMGENAGPKDRALAFHLFASRNLLYPSRQISTPIVVTPSSHDRLSDFACRALHALGYAGQPTMLAGLDSLEPLDD